MLVLIIPTYDWDIFLSAVINMYRKFCLPLMTTDAIHASIVVVLWVRLGMSPGFQWVLVSILMGILMGNVTCRSGSPTRQITEDLGADFGAMGTCHRYLLFSQ